MAKTPLKPKATQKPARKSTAATAPAMSKEETGFLQTLGERVRGLRARRGLTRKGLSAASQVSERHLANLETGVGNASILVLRQLADALDLPLAALLGDTTTSSPEWLMIREILQGRNEYELRTARVALGTALGQSAPARGKHHIALIGLRGAGKSTLGRMLSEALEMPFVELNAEIERVAGCSVPEIHNLLGPNAYRRYERRALEETVAASTNAVIATPGGIIADPATFNLMLAQCTTVWLKASPAEHMQRVLDQGDMRPMHGNREAMEDLKRILDVRAAFYAKADIVFDTSSLKLNDCFEKLLSTVRQRIAA